MKKPPPPPDLALFDHASPTPAKKRTWWKGKRMKPRADAARIAATARARAKGTFAS